MNNGLMMSVENLQKKKKNQISQGLVWTCDWTPRSLADWLIQREICVPNQVQTRAAVISKECGKGISVHKFEGKKLGKKSLHTDDKPSSGLHHK